MESVEVKDVFMAFDGNILNKMILGNDLEWFGCDMISSIISVNIDECVVQSHS